MSTKPASPMLQMPATGPVRRCSSRAGGAAAEKSPAVRSAGAGPFSPTRKDPAMATSPSRLAPLLTIPATAEKLGVSVRTVRRMIDADELHVHRLGRSIRISEEDLALFLIRHRK
jgi:excisionase family DNA binding protein